MAPHLQGYTKRFVNMAQLSSRSFRELFLLSMDKQEIILELQRQGLLHSHVVCENCNVEMRLMQRGDALDGWTWRCPLKKCKRRTSVRKDSYFADSKLGLETAFMLIYCYIAFPKMLAGDIAKIIDCERHTLIDWGNFIRETISHYFLSNPIILGGADAAVQIDESLFGGRRKYNRGDHHIHTKWWVFGIIEERSNRCVMWLVDKRNKSTLLPIIKRHIRPGTTIKSDEWGAYGSLDRDGFEHLTVNHSVRFVSDTGVHTQAIEALWSRVKEIIKARRGSTKQHLPGFLDYYSFLSEAKFLNIHPLELFFRIIQANKCY
jgi:transposase-like protein